MEIDGDATHNPQAIADVVDLMHRYNMGYCSVNHNRNRCMDCGGTTDRWNSGKLAELNDRVVHK